MTDDNEFLDLPPDSEEAFAIYQRRRMEQLEKTWEHGTSPSWHAEREYVDDLMAFDDVHGLRIFEGFSPPPTGDSTFGDYFQKFRRHAHMTSRKILIDVARRVNSGEIDIVVLDASTRTAIHQLIDQIRNELYKMSISEEMREKLFDKLNIFSREVDRIRTRTEAFYSAAHQFARHAAQFGDAIEPVIKKVDRIAVWLDKASKWKDTLPKWQDKKQIESPKKKIEKQIIDNEIDDIPF